MTAAGPPSSNGNPAGNAASNGECIKPLIGVTMGDPAGIGAEVIVKALADPALRGRARFLVFGLDEMLRYAADIAEVSPFWFHHPHNEIDRVQSGVVVADFDDIATPGPGVRSATPDGGRASLQFLDEAVAAAKSGMVDAIVTGPIHKVSWKMAGCKAPGHTEYLADAFNVRRVTMMFACAQMRVALATAHIGMTELSNKLNIGSVFRPIDQLDEALRRWFGVDAPKIAVAGLNPHAGEQGRFGDEERRVIEPAILMAREAGIDARGPFPADTLFWRAARGEFDGIVAMYHDQALIPIKLLAFDSSVNITLGLPTIRTSVDHGTAFDIAGKGTANAGSMTAALSLAIDLARHNAREDWPQRERMNVDVVQPPVAGLH